MRKLLILQPFFVHKRHMIKCSLKINSFRKYDIIKIESSYSMDFMRRVFVLDSIQLSELVNHAECVKCTCSLIVQHKIIELDLRTLPPLQRGIFIYPN